MSSVVVPTLGVSCNMDLFNVLKKYRKDRDMPWFTKAWDLNLFIIRSGNVGAWDDFVVYCCRDDSYREITLQMAATGDAWEGEWLNPSHPDGTVYVLDGHYPGGMELGKYKDRVCLRQRKSFSNVRWPADGTVPTIDQLETRAAGGHAFLDIRGTHLHNSFDGKAPLKPRRNESEGCTVPLYRHMHAAGMELVEQQKEYRGSAIVSPTFLKLSDLRRLGY